MHENLKYYCRTLSLLLFISICFLGCGEQGRSTETIFTENDSGWMEFGEAEWTFENNEIVGSVDNGSGFVMTKKMYKDFILEVEFQPDSTVNSGIFVRCKKRELSHTDCYEMNIWDLHPNQEFRTGAVVSRSLPLARVNTLNKWNSYKIKCEANRLQVWINDILTVDIEDSDLIEGYIALQAAETGQIRFKNAVLQKLRKPD